MTTKSQFVAIGATSLLSLAIGASAGYFFAKDRLGKDFDARLEYEVASAKRFYSKLHKQGEHDMPNIVEKPDMLPVEREAAQAMQRYQGNNTVEDLPKEEPTYEMLSAHDGEPIKGDIPAPKVSRNNIFDANSMSPEDLQIFEDLIKNRTGDAPYVISVIEFMENHPDHGQDTLVYFLGDKILVDARDEVVDDPDSIVGDDNLVKFGHFSGDPRTVYVRNETLKHDFEITMHEGTYSFVVHGIEPESENVEA